MLKTIKNFVLITAAAGLLFVTSCMDTIDPIERTEESELFELNEVLGSLAGDGYDIDTTELGVYYILHKEGEGPTPETGDTCFLEYEGFLFDGSLFDASALHNEDSIWQFQYKEINLIAGFDDGIALMNKGAEIDIIIPSEHAYGPYGYGTIEPYTPLLFSLRMHDIKPKQD